MVFEKAGCDENFMQIKLPVVICLLKRTLSFVSSSCFLPVFPLTFDFNLCIYTRLYWFRLTRCSENILLLVMLSMLLVLLSIVINCLLLYNLDGFVLDVVVLVICCCSC